ncbi:MAG: arylsulfatase [Fuerstiella sp.]|nr:arylsulfatase [Fuerstiella sp.]MCP4856880.1 arylsulfatase [Fuerstiella sp.]
MKRSLLTLVMFAALPACALAGSACAADQKPNVILVLTDDQGYGDLSCTGNDVLQTPNMDQLYGESARLTDFHVNSVCSPSRAAILTGQYASRVGVWHTLGGREVVRPDAVMMPQLFADNGYRTLMVGKWHLGDNFPFRPEDRGFHEVYRIGGGSIGQLPDYWGNGLWDTHYWNGKGWEPSTGFCTDTQFDAALRFVERNKEVPFYIYLSTTALHSPVGAPEDDLTKYDRQSKEVQSFYAMASNLDTNLGRLRGTLADLSLEDNTLLIFLSDNGSACDKKGTAGAFNAGMRGKKGSLYEGGHRVPCFIHWPGGDISGGFNVNTLTAHIDLLPTLIEACDLDVAQETRFDGRSLLPLLASEPVSWIDRTLVTESKVNNRSRPFDSSAVMSGSWRLVNNGKELYNVAADPGQENDLADEHVDRVVRLRRQYEDWYRSIANGFEKVARIVIGDQQENPVRLTCMDVYPMDEKSDGKAVWNQKGVLTAQRYRGLWKLEAAASGTYEVSLRRWPGESGLAFQDVPKKGQPVVYTEARLNVGKGEVVLPIDMSSSHATFTIQIEKGQLDLDAQLIDAQGQVVSAYYVEITRVR